MFTSRGQPKVRNSGGPQAADPAMRRAAWALAVWPWGMPAARPALEADSLAVAKLRDFNAQRGCAGAVCTVKLFFVHLHKCGGTTVESYFRQAYGDAFLVPDTGHEGELRDALVVQNKARIRALRAFARPYRVFARHIAYGYHATVDCARPLYMTMLREPTARLLSLYGYLMFGEGKKYRRFPANATFGEFVRHRTTGTCAESTGGVYQEYCLSNYQTRKICGYYAILETAEPSEETFRCAARHSTSSSSSAQSSACRRASAHSATSSSGASPSTRRRN